MRKRPLCMICLIFLVVKGLIMMITGGQPYLEVPASSIFSEMEDAKEITIQGQVYKKEYTSKYQILYLKNNSILFENNSFSESNILIYDDTFEAISIGQSVVLKGTLERFEKARNPGNFDQQFYYAKQNIRGFVWCEKIVSVTGKENLIKEKLHQFRQQWKTLFVENMSEENGGILSAILLSEKSEMDIEIKELYQKTGIGHILAISGLHISFIGLGIYRLLRRTGLSYTISGIIAALLLTAYVIMVGDSVSVMRAYTMLLLRIGADMSGRVYDMPTALTFSAALTVLFQPLYLMDAGFYLSYGAIVGILLVKPELEKLFPAKIKIWKNCIPGIAINLTLFPILLWFYFEVPTYSILLNLVVIPLMTIVMSLGIFGSIGYVICAPVGKVLLKLVDWVLAFFTMLGKRSSSLPVSSIVFGQPAFWKIVLYYIALIVVVCYLKNNDKENRIKTMRKYIVCVFVILTLSFIPFPNGKVRVTMIDVGQGDSIFLRGPFGHTYLMDGGSSDVKQVGKYRIEPFLKSQGVGTLDYVFVSHGDSDHYSGIQEMLERQEFGVKIKKLVLPANYQTEEELVALLQLAVQQGIQVSVMKPGEKITEGKLELKCLQPETENISLTGNAGSMVLDISFKNFDMLCTGDVEKEGEERLVENLNGKSYDVLKVAHHGSKNSTGNAFLLTVQPCIALISAGKGNSYGHPHTETLIRLQECGSSIYQTIEYGAITFETDGDFIDIFSSSI